jgi:O-Antigen ligase
MTGIKINPDLWLSRIGLGLIFCYCLLASIFFAYFAQIHLSVSFLPFPIFVGEVLLFICLLLLVWVCRDGRSMSRRAVFLLSLYFGWVLIKALINYHDDGPLTCRNAALFYYPIFAVFSYCFYQKADISRKILMPMAFLAAGIMFFKAMEVWFWWTYVILFVIAVWNIKSQLLRRFGWIFLAVIVLLGKEYLYKGPRAHFISVIGAVIFLVSYFGAFLAKRRDLVRLSILLGTFFLFISGYMIFGDRNAVHSLTSLKGMVSSYKAFDSLYQEREADYVPAKLTVHLYNPKVLNYPFSGDIVHSRIRGWRSLQLDETNIVFRLFVWRDMFQELVQDRAWWGFSFGHPQRSRSLEVLGWAKAEWARDGWITPHNSFFHIIYRAGILGIFLIAVLFVMIGGVIRDFFMMGSIEGGFLVSGLIYWLVLSNFFVILEFPYNAIIFWTLFGLVWAYRDRLKVMAVK